MQTNFLVAWNDEVFSGIAGPIEEDWKATVLHYEVVEMLERIHSLDYRQAEKIYRKCMSKGGKLKRTIYAIDIVKWTIYAIDIDLQVYGDGASLRYGGGKEFRLEFVQYERQD